MFVSDDVNEVFVCNMFYLPTLLGVISLFIEPLALLPPPLLLSLPCLLTPLVSLFLLWTS